MTKIIVVVMSTISAGELTISWEFVRRLPKDAYIIEYIIHSKHSGYLKSKGIAYFALDEEATPEVNREIALEYIERFQPNYFIISDVFTMEYASLWSGLKFSDIQGIAPIIGVDEYEFPSTNYSIDYYGFYTEKLPDLIERCDYLIRDCPINKVQNVTDRIKHFSLYDQGLNLEDDKKKVIKDSLGIKDDEKVIFFTTSSWELLNMHKVLSLSNLLNHLPKMLKNYLYLLNKKVTVIHVGAHPWGEIDNPNVRYLHFTNLLPETFDNYLLSSDIFLTFNIVSVSLTKAIYAGIPSVVLQNYKVIDFKKLAHRVKQLPAWYQEMANEVKIAYPFRASTFGWFKFISYVLQDNPYTSTFVEAPFFNIEKVLNTLKDYLYDDERIQELKLKQQHFVNEMLQLPTPPDIMEAIIRSEEGEEKKGVG